MTRKTLNLKNSTNSIRKCLSKKENSLTMQPEKYCANGGNDPPIKNNDGDGGGGGTKPEALNAKLTPVESLPTQISYFQLFRYSTIWERTLTIIGLIFASIASFGLPFAVIMYGEVTTLIVDRVVGVGTSTKTLALNLFGGGRILTNASKEENRLALIEDAEAFGIGSAAGALIQLITCAIAVDLINYSALKQIGRIRNRFLEAVLRQDMIWYDTATGQNFATKITDDLEKMKEGIAEKLAIFVYLVNSFVISIVFSFVYGWKLTLVILTCSPLIIITQALVAKIQSSLTEKELKSYSSAGSVAEEVLSGIRTVVAFSGERKETERYRERLGPAIQNGERKGLFTGIGAGIMWLIIYLCYALAFWYGVDLILQSRNEEVKEYTPAVLVIVLFGVLVGAQNLGLTSPQLEAFNTARGAAASIFSIIDRKPEIDSLSQEGLKPDKILGDIEFKDLHFRYPARKDVQVLQGLNLSIKAGQTVALVGPSGCGKSTLLQLFQRLYDPLEGYITVDNMELKELNTACLRSFIGVVGQEPVLFATTIAENIRYGNMNATNKEIEVAARIANCHEFIIKLPNGYETMIGERGTQLSGGQKQRIAIARALVRNPTILLLDEATSALDPTSEKRVQQALEKASKGRTTLVVSHRLSTITNSDKIVFIQNGLVEEEGTHEELMDKKGLYYALVNATNSNDNIGQKPTPRRQRKLSHRPSLSIHDSAEFVENDVKDEEIVEEDDGPDDYPVPMKRLMKLNAPEWKLNLLGSLAAFVYGGSLPVFAVLFGEFYGMFAIPDSEEVTRQSNMFSLFFVLLGLAAGLSTFLQTYMFGKSGVRLTARLREMTFKAIMSQEMGWFDETKNAVGVLCARLAGDCANVQGATGTRIGVLLQSVASIVIGIIMSFFFSWDLTLVAMTTIPLVLGAIYFEARYTTSSSIEEKVAIENASKMAVEAIANIRTVASLGQEPYILNRYTTEIDNVMVACRKKTRFRGLVFALGQSAPFFGYSLALYYGGYLVANEGLEYKNVIKVSEALIFGSWMLGQALAYVPNVNAALLSAARLLRLLDRVPRMHNPPSLPYNTTLKTEGNISYERVEFRYPTRQEVPVLQGLDLDVPKGNTVALVGPSGCGKSTCIQLLLRYYDPDEGRINLDGTATTDFPIEQIRSQLGLVSQEPVLFDRTIAENIAYGDNSRIISMAEIIDAAKNANIHEFISGLPVGYETRLGTKGTQLSGGQKQRIAIARALVRNPRILLLDEATSALDTHSEKVVQSALDSARAGRTCITIAHRLTTIQNADLICVIQSGVITEKGTHQELMALDKMYAKLYSMQQVT